MNEAFENERWQPLRGYSAKNLLITDRRNWSTRCGGKSSSTFEKLTGEWKTRKWKVVRDVHTDEDGWEYATDFPATVNAYRFKWHPTVFRSACVRRRCWLKTRTEKRKRKQLPDHDSKHKSSLLSGLQLHASGDSKVEKSAESPENKTAHLDDLQLVGSIDDLLVDGESDGKFLQALPYDDASGILGNFGSEDSKSAGESEESERSGSDGEENNMDTESDGEEDAGRKSEDGECGVEENKHENNNEPDEMELALNVAVGRLSDKDRYDVMRDLDRFAVMEERSVKKRQREQRERQERWEREKQKEKRRQISFQYEDDRCDDGDEGEVEVDIFGTVVEQESRTIFSAAKEVCSIFLCCCAACVIPCRLAAKAANVDLAGSIPAQHSKRRRRRANQKQKGKYGNVMQSEPYGNVMQIAAQDKTKNILAT